VTTPEPAVSVVITSYNLERFLDRAIDTALGQTLPGVEVIVVDDGSTDGSLALLRGYRDRVEVIEQENAGQGAAMNAGFARSRGPYVCFLDADDELLPDAMARCTEAFERAPAVGKVSFRLAICDAGGRQLGTTVPPAHVRPPSGDIRTRVKDSNDSWFTPMSGNVYRHTVLDRLMPVDAHLFPGGADYLLNRGSALLGPVTFLDEALGRYRTHSRNMGLHAHMNLVSVRHSMTRNLKAQNLLAELAAQEGLDYPAGSARTRDAVLLTQLMASCRLEPALHPYPADRTWRLAGQGMRAALARRDITPAARLAHASWFAAMAALPLPLARNAADRLVARQSRPAA